MCDVRSEDRLSAEKCKSLMRCLPDRGLQWFGHLVRMEESALSSKCRIFKVSDSFLTGRPRNTWNEVITRNLKERKVSNDLAKDRNAWNSFITVQPIQARKTDIKLT